MDISRADEDRWDRWHDEFHGDPCDPANSHLMRKHPKTWGRENVVSKKDDTEDGENR